MKARQQRQRRQRIALRARRHELRFLLASRYLRRMPGAIVDADGRNWMQEIPAGWRGGPDPLPREFVVIAHADGGFAYYDMDGKQLMAMHPIEPLSEEAFWAQFKDLPPGARV